MSHVSDSDHRRIEAVVFPDNCVVESHQISDPARGLRRVPLTKVWRTEHLLGRGGFGEVHLQSQDSDKDAKRVLKIISTRGVKLTLADCQRELTAMIEFTKPKYRDAAVFVNFIGWFQNDDAMFLAMEYMPLGDLEQNLREIEISPTYTGPPLSEEEVQEIIRQILEGLKIMHAEGFAHRDLKPQNVFVVQKHPQWWVKLGDFGLSMKRTEGTAYRTQAGTREYMAPELFYDVLELDTETLEYTNAIDLWSLGCIIYRIVTGKVPFPSMLSLRNYCIDQSRTPLNMPPTMEEARKFVQGLLMPHPANRPAACTALESIWLTTKTKPTILLNDKETSFANNYNTASHKGLQSYYSMPVLNNALLGHAKRGPASELPELTKVISEVKLSQEGKERRTQRNENRKIIEWMSQLNSWVTQNNIYSRCQEGTGLWFLQTEEFQNWAFGQEKVLWCPGNPGVGKTILTSVVMNHLRGRFKDRRDIGIAAIYCKYEERDLQSPLNMVASLCAQLIVGKGSMSDEVKALYNAHTPLGTRPSIKDFSQLLKSEIARSVTTYIIVDGLDECPVEKSIRDTLLLELRAISSIAKLMVTSRHHPDFVEEFGNAATLEIRAKEDDLRVYLSSMIPRLAKSIQITPGLQEDIINAIVQVADGMFLLARLYFESLAGERTVSLIKTALGNLPRGLEKYALKAAYRDAMRRIDEQPQGPKDRANMVLDWVINAAQPLKVAEIRHALAISPGDTDFNENAVPNEDTLTSYSAGLLIIDQENRTVRLAHRTTQEFLENDRMTRFPNGHAMIVERILTYLSFNAFAGDACSSRQDMIEKVRRYPFVLYAVRALGYHARQEPQQKNEEMVLNFLQKARSLPSVAQIMLLSFSNAYSLPYMKSISELQVAAFLGLELVCTKLLAAGFDVNRRDALDHTALHHAACMGHANVVKLLLDNNAEIAARNYSNISALYLAVILGHEAVVRILLNHGADREITSSEKMSLLCEAENKGHEAMSKLLRKHNFEGKMHSAPLLLHTAVEANDVAVLRELLRNGFIDVNEKGPRGLTALHIAVRQGDPSLVEILLDNEADITIGNSNGDSAMVLACHSDRILRKIVEKRPAQINMLVDRSRKTVLHWLAVDGKTAMVNFFLSKGADPRIQDIYGETPLHYAAELGHLSIVESLVNARSNLTLLDKGGRTPLRCAELNRHHAIVNFLFPKTEVVTDVLGRSELHFAALNGHYMLVSVFIDRGMSVSVQDRNGATPLHLAAAKGDLIIVKTLIAKGADKEACDKENKTPLDYAKLHQQLKLVRYLEGEALDHR